MKKIIILIFLLFTTNVYANDTNYLKFIESENPYLRDYRAKDILGIVKHFAPRYFKNKEGVDEGIKWTLSFMAHESSFRNVNGDGGRSIGYLQIQIPTCNLARKHNGIKRQMNLISTVDNIHCGMGELNRLYENLQGDWELIIKAYNGGLDSVLFPNDYKKANRMTDIYKQYIMKKRSKLDKIFDSNS